MNILQTIISVVTAFLVSIGVVSLAPTQTPTDILGTASGNRINYTQTLLPSANNEYDLGTTSLRYREGFINTLTVSSCTGCASASAEVQDLQDVYNQSAADAQVTAASAKDIIFWLQDSATDPLFQILSAPEGQGRLEVGTADGSATTTLGVWENYGRLGIATTSPGTGLAVQATSTYLGGEVYVIGQLTLPYLMATSTTATSTFGSEGGAGINLSRSIINGAFLDVGYLKATSTTATSTIGLLNVDNDFRTGDLAVVNQATFGGRIEVIGTATSSIPAILLSGNIATPNIKVTAQASFDGRLEVLGAATSSFAGGVSVLTAGGLSSAFGLTLTGGNLEAGVAGGRLLNLGVGSTSPSAILGVTGTSLFSATSTMASDLLVQGKTQLNGPIELLVESRASATTIAIDGNSGVNYSVAELTSDPLIAFDNLKNGSTYNLLLLVEDRDKSANFPSSTANVITMIWLNSKSTSTPQVILEGYNLCQFFVVATSSVPTVFSQCSVEGFSR